MRVDIHRYETRSAKNDDVFIPQVKKDIYIKTVYLSVAENYGMNYQEISKSHAAKTI